MERATSVIEEPAAYPVPLKESRYIQEVIRVIVVTAKTVLYPAHHDGADQDGTLASTKVMQIVYVTTALGWKEI